MILLANEMRAALCFNNMAQCVIQKMLSIPSTRYNIMPFLAMLADFLAILQKNATVCRIA